MNLHKLKWVYKTSLVAAFLDLCYLLYVNSSLYTPPRDEFIGGLSAWAESILLVCFIGLLTLWWLAYYNQTRKRSDFTIPFFFFIFIPLVVYWLCVMYALYF
jgi:hypothetical protein